MKYLSIGVLHNKNKSQQLLQKNSFFNLGGEMMHKRILFSKIYVNVIFIFDRLEIWSKIKKNKKF